MKIGLIKEGKIPTDIRVALTPEQCVLVKKDFPNIELFVQPSSNRSYSDAEYADLGIELKEDLSDCDLLLGIKEVPIVDLIENKAYCFFSHTKKKQPYNQKLMHALIEKRIRMIDYEALTYENGKRIIGFGFFAGVVGAHNAILTYGRKKELFELKPAHLSKDMDDMIDEYKNITLPPIKIVVTGDGRVAQGVTHILKTFKIKEVDPEDFLDQNYAYPVFTRLYNKYLYKNKETGEFIREEFHQHPEKYTCLFKDYISADILINGIYWDTNIDRLFEKSDVHNPAMKLTVISDITCDIDGSVPINLAASTIADPVYGYNKITDEKTAPFINDDNIIDIMAVDNLPNELPRDASKTFGEHIIKYIIPEFLKPGNSDILERATICKNGKLGNYFSYLEDYAFSK